MNRCLGVLVSVIGMFAGAAAAVSAQRAPQTRPEPGNKPIEIFTALAVQMQTGAAGRQSRSRSRAGRRTPNARCCSGFSRNRVSPP